MLVEEALVLGEIDENYSPYENNPLYGTEC